MTETEVTAFDFDAVFTPVSAQDAQDKLARKAERAIGERGPSLAELLVDRFSNGSESSGNINPAGLPPIERGDRKGDLRTAQEVASAINNHVRSTFKDEDDKYTQTGTGVWAKRDPDNSDLVLIYRRDPDEILAELNDPDRPKRGRKSNAEKAAEAAAANEEAE